MVELYDMPTTSESPHWKQSSCAVHICIFLRVCVLTVRPLLSQLILFLPTICPILADVRRGHASSWSHQSKLTLQFHLKATA